MFGIGGFELFIILLFGFLVFGPDKLPEIARTVGAALRKFKQAQAEMEAVIKDEVLDPDQAQGKKSASSNARSGVKPQPKAASSGVSQESFAQRKARFDKERSALQQEARDAQQIEANRRAMKDEASKKAAEAQAASSTNAAGTVASGTVASGQAASGQAAAGAEGMKRGGQTTDAATSVAAPTLTPDELFGLKPVGVNRPQESSSSASGAGSVSGAETPVLERREH